MVIFVCISSCLADELTTTEAPTATTYSPKPPVFNRIDCKRSFDSSAHKKFICFQRPDLFPILTYAEQVAKKTCEEDFKNELWNCSNFSLLKEPLITKGGELGLFFFALCMGMVHACASDM